MHTIKVGVFGPDEEGKLLSLEALKPTMANSISRIPSLRQRPMRVPLGLGQPIWIADAEFNLERHARTVDIGPDGDLDKLFELVSEFASTPLDTSRPLWELIFVKGLAGQKTASILKIHHAIADGGETVEMFEQSLDAKPDAPQPDYQEWRGDDVPSRLAVAGLVLRQIGRAALRFPSLLWNTLAGLWRSRSALPEGASAAGVFQGPAGVSFNGPLTAQRRFVGVTVPFDRLRAVKKAAGSSLNDAFLAVCGGALRRYLAGRDELPDKPLVTSVPVALPGERSALQGNAVSSLYCELATDEADPRARLVRIKAGMDAAKAQNKAAAIDVAAWMDEVPPVLSVLPVRTVGELVRAGAVRSPINLITSNVKGPPRLYRRGRPLQRLWSSGPLVEGVGLNITAWSYDGEMSISLLGCPDRTPDLDALGAQFEPALVELEEAFGTAASAPAQASSSS